jgi:hypothetical protein
MTLTESDDGNDLQAHGIDDTGRLAERLATPGPPPYNTMEADEFIGTGEAAMHHYVYANMQAGAGDRRMNQLELAPHGNRGSQVKIRARFDNLMEVCQRASLQAGGLRFRIVQGTVIPTPEHTLPPLWFETSEPSDKSGLVRFSREFANIRSMTFTETAPDATSIIVGGIGQGTERALAIKQDQEAITQYGLMEFFIDRRDEDDVAEIAKAADDALEAGKYTQEFTFEPDDVEPLTFGDDYDLGDKVTMIVDGVTWLGLVTSVHLSITPEGGAKFTPTVTTATVPQLLRNLDDPQTVPRRVSRLERFAETLTDAQIIQKGFGTYAPLEHDVAHADTYALINHDTAHDDRFALIDHDSAHDDRFAPIEHDSYHADVFMAIGSSAVVRNSYTGDGTAGGGRQMNLGFIPKLVKIWGGNPATPSTTETSELYSDTASAYATNGGNVTLTTRAHLSTVDGFRIGDGLATDGGMNVSGRSYTYIAWR